MKEDLEKLRERMWDLIMGQTETYTDFLLKEHKLDEEQLQEHLSAGFDVISGVLAEWVATVNRDIMDLSTQEHTEFIENMLESIKEDLVNAYSDLEHEDEIDEVIQDAEQIANQPPEED